MNSGCSASKATASCSARCRAHGLVPPLVAARLEGDVVLGAPHDEHVLDAAGGLADRLVDGGLQREDPPLAVAAVGGDDELRLGVVDARREAVGAEAAEDDRVDGADARDREHRDDGLGDHRQVDGDAVSGAHAEALEHVRGALDLVGELGVGDVAAVAGLALEVDGDPVAEAGLDVAVEAVDGDVELAVVEPLRERRVRPVEGAGEGLVPGEQLTGLVGPEGEAVGLGCLVEGRVGNGLGGELGARAEAPDLLERVIDLNGHGSAVAPSRLGSTVGSPAPPAPYLQPANQPHSRRNTA